MDNIQKEKTRFYIEEEGHLVGEVRWRVLPSCSYVANYLDEHEEYQDLLI